MYIVNTSFMVHGAVHEQWLEFMHSKYIPFLKENGCEKMVFTRVLSTESEEEFTYSLQIPVNDISGYKRVTDELFSEYKMIANGLFGDKVLYFTTLMKLIEII